MLYYDAGNVYFKRAYLASLTLEAEVQIISLASDRIIKINRFLKSVVTQLRTKEVDTI
jgi:hypothetical protein